MGRNVQLQLTRIIEEQQKVIDDLRNSSTHISKTHTSRIEIANEYYLELQRKLETSRFELQRATLQNASLRAQSNTDRDALDREKALCYKLQKMVEVLQMSIAKERVQKQELVDQVIAGRTDTAKLTERNQALTLAVSNLRNEVCVREEILNKNLNLNVRSNLLNAELTKEKSRLQTENGAIQAALTTAYVEIKQYRDDHSILSNIAAIHSVCETRIQELETLVETQREKIISQDSLINTMLNDIKGFHASQDDRQTQDHTYISLLMKKNIEQEEIISKMEKEKSIQESFMLEKENMFKMLQEDYSSLQVVYIQKKNDAQKLKEDHLKLKKQTRCLEMELKELLTSNDELSKKHIYSIKELNRVQEASALLNSKLKKLDTSLKEKCSREIQNSHALRQYCMLNRKLKESFTATKLKLKAKSETLSRVESLHLLTSTKRSQLQKELTREKCQYQDLMQYCMNLEEKFVVLEKMSQETEHKLEVVQKENKILQKTVGGLCNYSSHILHSESKLNEELLNLEISGKRELFLYG